MISLDSESSYLINPGTVGHPRTKEASAQLAIVDLDKGALMFEWIAYDYSAVLKQTLEVFPTGVKNYGFEAENGESSHGPFQTIPNSFVPGHGTTNVPQHYSFTDNGAAMGSRFYRLKQTDLDGTIYSTTEPVEGNGDKILRRKQRVMQSWKCTTSWVNV